MIIRTIQLTECDCCHATLTADDGADENLFDQLRSQGWRTFELVISPFMAKADEDEQLFCYWLCGACSSHAVTAAVAPFRELMNQPARLHQLGAERLEHVTEIAHAIVRGSTPPDEGKP